MRPRTEVGRNSFPTSPTFPVHGCPDGQNSVWARHTPLYPGVAVGIGLGTRLSGYRFISTRFPCESSIALSIRAAVRARFKVEVRVFIRIGGIVKSSQIYPDKSHSEIKSKHLNFNLKSRPNRCSDRPRD